MSFLTCFWLFPQKEHLSRSPPSPIRATRTFSLVARDRSGPVSTTVQPSEPRGSPLTPRWPNRTERPPEQARERLWAGPQAVLTASLLALRVLITSSTRP